MSKLSKKRTLRILGALTVACLSIGVLQLHKINARNDNESKINEEILATKDFPTAISAYSDDEVTSTFLIPNQDTAITSLITSYYDAILNVDKESYDAITVDDDSMDVDVMLRKMEYIEGYDNQKIYVTQGLDDTGIVVYVTYDLKIHSIDTKAPSIDQFLITYKDGIPKLYFNTLSFKQSKHIEKILQHEEVLALIAEVDFNFNSAIHSDSKLNDFYVALSQATASQTEK